jgi:hypothetical protein
VCNISAGTPKINKQRGTVVAGQFGLCQRMRKAQQKMKIFAFSN